MPIFCPDTFFFMTKIFVKSCINTLISLYNYMVIYDYKEFSIVPFVW
jgi:hypothetical protein